MFDRDDQIPTIQQWRMLEVARSTVYYQPKPATAMLLAWIQAEMHSSQRYETDTSR